MRDMACFDLPWHTIKTSKMIHVSTGVFEHYIKAVKLAREMGKKVSFDPGPEIHYQYDRPRLEAMLPNCDYLFLNEHEMKVMLGNLAMTRPEEVLPMAPAMTIVMTRGKEGSSIFTREGRTDTGIYRVEKVVDPTGAGDAFRSGFYAGLFKGADLATCARYGAVVSSFIVEGWGPQANIPDWEKIEARLPGVQ
jgi:nucleoside kinase